MGPDFGLPSSSIDRWQVPLLHIKTLALMSGLPRNHRSKGERAEMQVHTLGYDRKKHWSLKNRPRIDSSRTLVLLFGPSSLLDSADPLSELINDYPESVVIGCSTAGEILGTQISDESVECSDCSI